MVKTTQYQMNGTNGAKTGMDRKTELIKEYIRRTHDGRIEQCKGTQYGGHDFCVVCNFQKYCEDHTAYMQKMSSESQIQRHDRTLLDADIDAIADKVIERVKELLGEILAGAQIVELGGFPDVTNEQSKK